MPTLDDISLRRFGPEDAAAVREWFSNPDATGDLMDESRADFSEEDAKAWIERAMDESGKDRKWAIMMAGEKDPVGFTALYGINSSTPPELGCVLGADAARGMGLGREAERLTIAKAFDEYDAHKVYGRIPATNQGAKKAVASLGWKHEGTLRSHIRRRGELVDCEIWGVLPGEFRAATADR
ncbi:MAG: GNAT family N-acetyltransferase [Solirubrobacterales bacterium]